MKRKISIIHESFRKRRNMNSASLATNLVLLLLCLHISRDVTIVCAIAASPQDIPFHDRIQYRAGDILIGAAMSVSHRNANGTCVEELFGIQLVEQMNMIIDQVNSNSNILKGVKLGTIMIDTCSSESHALQRTITDILPLVLSGKNCSSCQKHSPLAGVVGASYSSVSMQLARILQVFSIPQVSYWSTSVELSDKIRFPYFFRSVASDIHQVEALVTFFKQRNWNYISVVYSNDNYGLDGFAELVRVASLNDICIAYSKPVDISINEENSEEVVKDILSKDKSRVVVLFVVSVTAENILSAAQRIPGTESLVWIGVDGWTAGIPRDHRNNDYLNSLDGVIGFVPKLGSPENFAEYMTNLTLQENYGENLSRNPWFPCHISTKNNCSLPNATNKHDLRVCDLTESIDPSSFRLYESPLSDAVYAFVFALDQYHKAKCKGQAVFCDEMKNFAGTTELASDIFPYLKNVSFSGMGNRRFMFDENLDGPPTYEILTFSKKKVSNMSENLLDGWVKAGVYSDDKLSWSVALPDKIASVKSSCSAPCAKGEAEIQGSTKCCWFCQKCAPTHYVENYTECKACPLGYRPNKAVNGCTSLSERVLEYSSIHSIFVLTLGTFGLFCTSIVTVIFIKYRETAIVRASGKELCFFVLTGIFITLLNCFTVTLRPSQYSCAITRVLLTIGPSCMYVGLLMKTIRVVFIFQSKKIMKTKIKRYLQPMEFTLITTAVASLQIVVLVVWILLQTPNVEKKVFEDHVFKTCEILVHINILYGLIFPFLIIIICTILATINRNVPTGFKETLYIGFTMYTTCVIWLSFVPIFSTNSSDIPLKLATVSAALSFSAITVLLCLFVPRCYVILFNPTLNTTESVMSRKRSQGSTVTPDLTVRQPVEMKTEASCIPSDRSDGSSGNQVS